MGVITLVHLHRLPTHFATYRPWHKLGGQSESLKHLLIPRMKNENKII